MVIDVVAGRPARSSEDRLAVVEAAAVSETAVRTMVDDRRMVVVEDTEAVAAGPAMAPAAGEEQERPMAAATVMELEERHRPGTHGSIKLERSRSIVSEWV